MKLHNAMWPGLVGKEPDTDHPPISLEHMLELTTAAEVNGRKFDGVDLFVFHPHTDPNASEDSIKAMADKIAAAGLKVGSLVAPVWPGTVGGSAFGSDEDRKNFVLAVESALEGEFAAEGGERIAAEGEICWGGFHSWKAAMDTLEATAMPGVVGFQADLAHTYLYLMGYNAPEAALLKEGYSDEEFWAAYKIMTDALRPWTIDFHVAQNDGSVHGTGSHDKTGRHCPADDANGRLDIAKCSTYWLQGAAERGIKHICWDGCMFPNATLENPTTWNTILDTMLKGRDAHGWV